MALSLTFCSMSASFPVGSPPQFSAPYIAMSKQRSQTNTLGPSHESSRIAVNSSSSFVPQYSHSSFSSAPFFSKEQGQVALHSIIPKIIHAQGLDFVAPQQQESLFNSSAFQSSSLIENPPDTLFPQSMHLTVVIIWPGVS